MITKILKILFVLLISYIASVAISFYHPHKISSSDWKPAKIPYPSKSLENIFWLVQVIICWLKRHQYQHVKMILFQTKLVLSNKGLLMIKSFYQVVNRITIQTNKSTYFMTIFSALQFLIGS